MSGQCLTCGGGPAAAGPLPTGVRSLLEAVWGIHERPTVQEAELPAVVLPEDALRSIRNILGPLSVLTDDCTRRGHTRGKSTPALPRWRAGELSDAPDVVVRPGSHDEVVGVLDWAGEYDLAVVPFGGGASVVGTLAAARRSHAGVAGVDLGQMRELVAVDPVSLTATLQPGLGGSEAEALLAAEGLTLGHFPHSFEYATIGGVAATNSGGQASSGYGWFDAMVVGLRVATPTGDLCLGPAPASAVGPDLRQVFLGSAGVFGIITEVTVRVRPQPEAREYASWRWPSFERGAEAMRRLAQAGSLPAVLRLSDETETAVNDPGQGGCLMIVGLEGTAEQNAARKADLDVLLRSLGGSPLGAEPWESWAIGGFAGPRLRDSLLDAGVLVETLETASFWSLVPRLHAAVGQALRNTLANAQPVVMCHISHVYPTGCSLFFTLLARAAEIGERDVDVLRAIKRELDPAGILNPGVLVR
jgi:alkyldihydroxyacetonephosphate synthase